MEHIEIWHGTEGSAVGAVEEEMYLKNGNLVIRSAEVKDAVQLNTWWNDGAVMAHAGFPNGLGEALEDTIAGIKKNEKYLSQRCIIEIDGVLAGEMSFYLLENNTAEIGIKICETAYQNQGYGSKLIWMLVTYLFEDEALKEKFQVQRIILDTNLKNERAQHVYEKLGFTRIRVNYGAWRDQLGVLQDSVDYEMTKEQFEQLKMQ